MCDAIASRLRATVRPRCVTSHTANNYDGCSMNTITATTGDERSPSATAVDDYRLWDANDVARFIGASRSWVYHQAEAGRLPCIRLLGFLRFDPRVVRAFVLAASSAPARLKSGDTSGASGR